VKPKMKGLGPIRLVTVCVLSMGCVMTAGCAGAPRPPRIAPRPGLVNHLVLLKLKDPALSDSLIRDADRAAAQIPGITGYFCGRHLDTGRAGVDSGYDVAFYVALASPEDLSAYLAHPAHQALVQRWKPLAEWMRIHDVLDPTP